MAVVNLKDLLTPEERERVEQRYRERVSRSAFTKIAPEVWITARLGVYYGWQAIEAVKRGYIESYEEKDGVYEKVLLPFTLEEALMLLDAADAAHNQMVARHQTANYYATAAAFSKNGFSAMEKDLKNRTKVELDD